MDASNNSADDTKENCCKNTGNTRTRVLRHRDPGHDSITV